MSWQRCGHPLRYFLGESHDYVFSDGLRVTDYDSSYPDNASFCELLGHMVLRETGDEEYANKIVFVLARKLGCSDLLRPSVRAQWEAGKPPRCFATGPDDDRYICYSCIYSKRCLDAAFPDTEDSDD